MLDMLDPKTSVMERMGFPTHLALMELAYEDERTDVHAIACSGHGRDEHGHEYVVFECVCGFTTGQRPSELDAAADLISHALNTCAVCHEAKPADNFPRCSAHAF